MNIGMFDLIVHNHVVIHDINVVVYVVILPMFWPLV
jgi:hypothetical protein